MRPHTLLLLAVSCWLLAACAPAAAAPVALPAQIAAGERLLIPLDTVGAAEAAATLTVVVRVYDDATGEAMEADVYWIEAEEFRPPRFDEWHANRVHGFNLTLDSKATGWLVLMADGYEVWKLRVSYAIKTSRVMELPVRMVREGGNGDEL